MNIGDTTRRVIVMLLGTALATSGLAGGGRSAAGAMWPAAARSPLAIMLIGPAGAGRHPMVPEPGVFSALVGVYCTAPASCWAVGTYNPSPTVGLNEMLHWNGSRWVRIAVPSPAGTRGGDVSLLQSIRCARTRDCWAVGVYQRKLGAIFGQALHWNGTKWISVPVPQAGGHASGSLTVLDDVACPSVTNCWAVGDFGNQGAHTVARNQALHWNGRKWALARPPQPAGTAVDDINVIRSIRCTSSANCLAVGIDGTLGGRDIVVNQALRWNGRKWSTVSVVSPGGTGTSGDFSELNGLACSSARNCWAAGTYSPDGSMTRFSQMLHWNGSTWIQIAVPEPGGTAAGAQQELLFAACGSPIDCWAVGDFNLPGNNAVIANQTLHWDGGAWSFVDAPDPAGVSNGDINRLAAVRCVSAASCWAVGLANFSGGPDFGQTLHWDGTRWSVR